MERIEWKGDFLGFTFGGVHSSSLGIVRTSDGSRYNENFLPEFEDKIVKVPGRDETYYFGSEYKQRTFEIKIAFDNMTDKQFRQLRQLMSGQELKDLIFDEAPYKVYKVKANGTPNLSYLSFDEEYRRIYKGEGTLQFIAYFPFARSRYKYIEDYTPKNIPEWGGIQDNKMEWLEASGIPSKNKNYTVIRETIVDEDNVEHTYNPIIQELDIKDGPRESHVIILKNSGDIFTDIKLFFINRSGYRRTYKISLKKIVDNIYTSPIELGHLTLDVFRTSGGFELDTYSHLITYYSQENLNNRTNGINSNDFIVNGSFFKIPPTGDNEYLYIETVPCTFSGSTGNWTPQDWVDISEIENYNYLYY